MLGVPERYKQSTKIDIKTFITKDLSKVEKKRFMAAVINVMLVSQITGNEIPTLINEKYDCQAILFLDVKIKNMKDASFIGSVIQRIVKPLCVIRFIDNKNLAVYSFAHKRVNMQDRNQVVIENLVFTATMSTQFEDEINIAVDRYIAYDKIKNISNKLGFYMEMMVKAYIISNLTLWSGSKALLNTNIWYNTEEVLATYNKLKKLETLKLEMKKTDRAADKVRINSDIKMIIQELENY